MTAWNNTKGWILLPRDGWLIKDGRGWGNSTAGRGVSLPWPLPPTVRGALRTAFGRSLEQGAMLTPDLWREKTAAVLLGPTLALRRPGQEAWRPGHRMWPMPADAVFLKGETHITPRLPTPPACPTLSREDDPVREALWRAHQPGQPKPEPAPPWWDDASFLSWLAGQEVEKPHPDQENEPGRRFQIGVRLDRSTGTAHDGFLYAMDLVETLQKNGEWALALQAGFPEERDPLTGRHLTLGGNGKTVQAEAAPDHLFACPESLLQSLPESLPGLRLITVTPACFQKGWLPDPFQSDGQVFKGKIPPVDEEVILRAAMHSRPMALSGWDMAANRPKDTHRLVPPGAVYFVEKSSAAPFSRAEFASLWLATWGERQNEGLGCLVPGLWQPKPAQS